MKKTRIHTHLIEHLRTLHDVLIVFFLIPILLINHTCKGRDKIANHFKVSVDSVSVEKINAQKGIVKLKILGTLPNPAYEIHHVETNIESDEIVIIPWAIHDPNKVVIQMIVSFEKEVEIKGLKKGTYTLIVKGSEKECLKKLELE